MVEIEFTDHFKKMLRQKSKQDAQKIKRTVERLQAGDTSPGLRRKPMKGYRNIWEASPTMGIRITFSYQDDGSILFRKNCEHDKVLGHP